MHKVKLSQAQKKVIIAMRSGIKLYRLDGLNRAFLRDDRSILLRTLNKLYKLKLIIVDIERQGTTVFTLTDLGKTIEL